MEEIDADIKKAYENLATAIIVGAANDYRSAIIWGNVSRMKAIEKWFHSDMFTAIAPDGISGDFILEKLRKERRYDVNGNKNR